MSIFAQKVQTIIIDSQYTRGVDRTIAAALYVEE